VVVPAASPLETRVKPAAPQAEPPFATLFLYVSKEATPLVASAAWIQVSFTSPLLTVPVAVLSAAAGGGVPSIFTVWLVLPEALPTASAPEYTTLCDALSPLTVMVRGAAEVMAPAPSRFVVAVPMPTPAPSLPLTANVTGAVNQPAQDPPLQVADIVGAVRSESGLWDALLPLVKK